MGKLTAAQLAAKYQNRPTKVAARPHYKGCQFGDHVIETGEPYKETWNSVDFKNACIPCVNNLAPPVQKQTPTAIQAPLDCSPPTEWAKLFEKEQANTAEAQRLLAELSKEAKIVRDENEKLKEALKFFELLVDAAMKLIAQERKFTSTAFMSERLAIKRLLIMMNRWTDG